MLRSSLFRSTPFRLALGFGTLFVSAFLAMGFVAYQLMRAELSAGLDNSAREIWEVVAATDADGDLEDIVGAVDIYSRLSKREDRIFVLLDPAGKRLAGNFSKPPTESGLSMLSAEEAGLSGDGNYRVVSGKVGNNWLSVGLSLAETDRLALIALKSMGWALAIITVTAFALSAYLADRIRRRLDSIADTMVDVSNGKLAARIPLTGNGDDIDAVSGQINTALERLAALVEGMRQVSTDIAHDLKTPLNRLKMTIDAAIGNNERGKPVGDELSEARVESDRINQTFDALLRIAQIESGSRKARFAATDLDEIMNFIEEIYADVAEDDGKVLTTVGDFTGLHPISGDRELLVQMFANLVENAIRHCPPGTRITMSAQNLDDMVVIEICDNGVGIAPVEREKVFQRLYRTEKSRTTPGSGLGLSLVRAIADLHGASLTLDDNHPGLKVRIAFPMRS
ncbi:HAMP domain-containing sensor histidine kinase [Aminobacter sp. AP02]|uniref:sensor histidine kinase n=1 Tax=Aminobacter sp. AP02 TaxID=2135737 RepID=UPI000D6D549D|nr:HAMP domain-containing sensor histidine kinase [Aminobacter sp. AP02]PWK59446.1 signal transduction histidine kinase [Aminobacter sp. AP02]